MTNGFTYNINLDVSGANGLSLLNNSLLGFQKTLFETEKLKEVFLNGWNGLQNLGLPSFKTQPQIFNAPKLPEIHGINETIKNSQPPAQQSQNFNVPKLPEIHGINETIKNSQPPAQPPQNFSFPKLPETHGINETLKPANENLKQTTEQFKILNPLLNDNKIAFENTQGGVQLLANGISFVKNKLQGGLMPTFQSFTNNHLIPGINWITQNSSAVLEMAKSFGIGENGLNALSSGFKIYDGVMAFTNSVMPIFTALFGEMNVAMWANPITLVVAGIAALGVAIVYAWNKFEGFRGFMYGMGYAIKEFGNILYLWFINPLVAAGQILIGTFTGNLDLIQKGMDNTLLSMKSYSGGFSEAGKKIGDAFKDGWNKGVGDFRLEHPVAVKTNAVQDAFKGQKKEDKTHEREIKQKADGISGGGRSIRNIVINVGKVGVDALTIQTQNITEGSAKMRDIIMRDLLQVINSANQVQ